MACEPVPNACPGSITTSSAPGGSHGGRTVSGPIWIGLWKLRQFWPQSSGSTVVVDERRAGR